MKGGEVPGQVKDNNNKKPLKHVAKKRRNENTNNKSNKVETKENTRKCEGRNLKSFFLAVFRIFYFILRGVE